MSCRDPQTVHLLKWLRANPRLDGIALDVAMVIQQAADDIADLVNDGLEMSAGLRKLREAKDCFVIQALEDCRQ